MGLIKISAMKYFGFVQIMALEYITNFGTLKPSFYSFNSKNYSKCYDAFCNFPFIFNLCLVFKEYKLDTQRIP